MNKTDINVSRVSFQEIKDMFPNFQIDLALITYFPFLSRTIWSVLPSFYVHLKKINFLNSHLNWSIEKYRLNK